MQRLVVFVKHVEVTDIVSLLEAFCMAQKTKHPVKNIVFINLNALLIVRLLRLAKIANIASSKVSCSYP